MQTKLAGVGLAMLLVAACDHLPGAEPKGDLWHLVLVNQKSTVYGGASCVNQATDPYCKTWVTDSFAFSGTLRRTTEWKLDLGKGGVFYATDAAQSVDTVIVNVMEPTGCGSYELFFRTHRDSIFGRFLR